MICRKIGVNVDQLPDYSIRSEYKGSRDGEIKMFKKEDKGYVYKWSVWISKSFQHSRIQTHGLKLVRFLEQVSLLMYIRMCSFH